MASHKRRAKLATFFLGSKPHISQGLEARKRREVACEVKLLRRKLRLSGGRQSSACRELTSRYSSTQDGASSSKRDSGGSEDFYSRGCIWTRRRVGGEPQTALAGRRTGAAASQLPTFFQRTTHFTDRHVDADRGAVVAGLPADRLGIEVGGGGICQPDSGVPVCSDRWDCCGSQQPQACSHRHAGGVDGVSVCAGGVDTDGHRVRVGRMRACGPSG